MINTDDLCDAQVVADLAGLRHSNSVHTYLRRYADMPRPVIDLGPGRPRLWLRPQIEAWLSIRSGVAHGAPETETVTNSAAALGALDGVTS
jgi:glutathione-regulated potassium-efflux system ancillary protein KefG